MRWVERRAGKKEQRHCLFIALVRVIRLPIRPSRLHDCQAMFHVLSTTLLLSATVGGTMIQLWRGVWHAYKRKIGNSTFDWKNSKSVFLS